MRSSRNVSALINETSCLKEAKVGVNEWLRGERPRPWGRILAQVPRRRYFVY